MPSFYKKDSGSGGHRGHRGPSMETTASSEHTCVFPLQTFQTWLCTFCIFILNYVFKSWLLCIVPVSDYATWRASRSQMNASANVPLANKSTPGLLPRPPQQTIHGRTDWSAKYGHRQWPHKSPDLCPGNCFTSKEQAQKFYNQSLYINLTQQ